MPAKASLLLPLCPARLSTPCRRPHRPVLHVSTPRLQHEARVQKEAEAKLAAARKGASPDAAAGGAEQQAGSAAGGSAGRKAEGKLLFDLVYEGEAELCIKASSSGLWWMPGGCLCVAVEWDLSG